VRGDGLIAVALGEQQFFSYNCMRLVKKKKKKKKEERKEE